MSILIKGMEMPTSCGTCPIRHMVFHVGDECYLGAKITEYQRRPEDCPLGYVPPHGRLIDADALMENVKTVDYIYRKVLRWLIDHASTFIEAENPFYESLKRGLEQALNGEVRETTITDVDMGVSDEKTVGMSDEKLSE